MDQAFMKFEIILVSKNVMQGFHFSDNLFWNDMSLI
jgi:hypothetical protein